MMSFHNIKYTNRLTKTQFRKRSWKVVIRIGDLIEISRKGDNMTADTSYFGLVDQYAANGKRIRLRLR